MRGRHRILPENVNFVYYFKLKWIKSFSWLSETIISVFHNLSVFTMHHYYVVIISVTESFFSFSFTHLQICTLPIPPPLLVLSFFFLNHNLSLTNYEYMITISKSFKPNIQPMKSRF